MTTDIRPMIDKAVGESGKAPTRTEIEEIVSSVLKTLDGEMGIGDLRLYSELQSLSQFIQTAKAEIAAIRPEEISTSHIPNATDQLDAVVGATEDATNRIMDACDHITNLSAMCEEEVNGKLMEQVMSIYEACNFQDLTGQRISKVVKALKTIEEQIDRLLVAFGEEAAAAKERLPHAPVVDPHDDKTLLNGPALPGQGIDQSAIDKLFD